MAAFELNAGNRQCGRAHGLQVPRTVKLSFNRLFWIYCKIPKVTTPFPFGFSSRYIRMVKNVSTATIVSDKADV